MEHIMAALFTLGFLGTHPHPQLPAPQIEPIALHAPAPAVSPQLEQRDQRILAINAWMRHLRGGHTHTPPTVAQRSRRHPKS